jgi:hypothetical protein
MEIDQLRYVLDDRLGVLQIPEALTGNPCANHLVVVERHSARADLLRSGLADVMKQCGKSQDKVIWRRLVDNGECVGKYILVTVMGILFHRECGQFGQEVLGEPRLNHRE